MPTLFVHHYHFRPGGVRRVIERGLGDWARTGRWNRIVLSSGEEIETGWLANLRKSLVGVELETLVDHRLGYAADFNHESLNEELDEVGQIFRESWRKSKPNLVWVHNLSVGRNVRLGLALGRMCQAEGIPMLCHHHDWWVEQRWNKWREMNDLGIDSLDLAAEATLPTGPQVLHACVHPRDAKVLARHFGSGVAWVPNPAPEEVEVAPSEIELVRERLGNGPLWLAPCRILRRKNLIEAVMLTKLLRPEATCLISGRPSSAGEVDYAKAVAESANVLGLNHRFGVADDENLNIPALMASAECVLQTSVQEGFGLPVLEAAELRRPLILRELPELTPWLVDSGGKFPLLYRDIEIPKRLISQNEMSRWEIGWEDQCAQLPAAWRNLAKSVPSSSSGTFSGFSVAGQLELVRNWDELETGLLEANSWLQEWKSLASANKLPPATAPKLDRNWVDDMERLLGQSPSQGSAMQALEDLFKTALPDAGRFPMLWQSPQTRGGK